ncbi:RISC-loading complex subunit tarbp2-like isoform X1 [Hylaeus volcanicus]|uniref:RISC-loading complex subunit tarbp2-like isoform X1 n=1 Tax=Hylaeus volcanicus TaxID=313075 RepID=UPI0023B7F882|nr:RISC-loading complex subunit tarbp2-like isoform X1 [Hylaeus volcanicus]
MSKTPIMVLQEFTIKQGELPHYTEISSGLNNGKNQFTIEVKWKNYYYKGIGTTKKEAKQNAAKGILLLLIQLKEISEDILSLIQTTQLSNIIVPSTNTIVDQVVDVPVPATNLDSTSNSLSISNADVCSSEQNEITNYVGYLQEYCKANNVPDPCYALVATTGPSHHTMFTMSCTVASTYKEASGNKKKIAKQGAAKQVFEYLTRNNNNKKLKTYVDELSVGIKDMEVDEVIGSKTKKAIEIYRNLKSVPILLQDKAQIKDYHNILTNFFCNISQVQKDSLTDIYKADGYYSSDLNNLKSIIYDTLKIPLKRITFTTNKNMYAIGLGLHTAPMIFQIGTGITAEEAEKQTLRKLVEHMFLYFK